MKLTPVKRHSDSDSKTTKLNLKKEVNAANTIAPQVQKNSLEKQRQRHIDIEMNNMRRTISRRLTQSKVILKSNE
jgi:DNA-binding transcriptional regulator GbsR (MarR family)